MRTSLKGKRAEILELRAKGWTTQQIADYYGTCRQNVSEVAGNLGSREKQGYYTIHGLAKRYHMNQRTIQQLFDKASIKPVKQGSYYVYKEDAELIAALRPTRTCQLKICGARITNPSQQKYCCHEHQLEAHKYKYQSEEVKTRRKEINKAYSQRRREKMKCH